MEVEHGRHQDPQGTADTSHEVLRPGAGMETLQGGAEEEIRQWHQDIHGRTISADRRDIQEQPRADGTMAFNTLHTHQ